MKRIKTISAFLTAFCLLLSAAPVPTAAYEDDATDGYEILGMLAPEADSRVVSVRLAAANDCLLTVALYGTDGRMICAQTEDVTGSLSEQVIPVEISRPGAHQFEIRTFLLDSSSLRPLCERSSSSVDWDDKNVSRSTIDEMAAQGQIDLIQNADGNISSINGQFTADPVADVSDAAGVLDSVSSLFGGHHVDPDDLTEQILDDGLASETFYRYSPTVDGLPVYGSQVILAVNQEGAVSGLFNSYDGTIDLTDTRTQIGPSEAGAIAFADLLAREEIEDRLSAMVSDGMDRAAVEAMFRDSVEIQSELVVFAVRDPAVLSYAVTIDSRDLEEESGEDEDTTGEILPGVDVSTVTVDPSYDANRMPMVSYTYFISANGDACGSILSSTSGHEDAFFWSNYSITASDMNGATRTVVAQGKNGIYRLKDATRNIEIKDPSGKIIESETTGDGDILININAFTLLANLSAVYDFYNDLGRKSFNGSGKAIKATVGDTSVINNAYWSSTKQRFVFGTGNYEAALDVAGHEFTHAVINSVVKGAGLWRFFDSGLHYENESGALNESYADIMGSLIEGKSDINKWLIAEDRGSAIRSMASPSLYGDPEHFDDRYTGSDDHGGVHTNSGIFNHAAYLMMTDSRTSGISDARWGELFYRSLYRLTTTATFLDARGAVVASANALGFTTAQIQAIEDAFDNVGIRNVTHPNIPDDAIPFNGHLYKIYEQSMTWIDAKAQCENMGGHLVTITSQEEQDFLNSLVQDKANLFWIGLHLNQETWEWITGESLSYTNWGSGEPNSDFNSTEFCVDMYGRPDRYFHLGEWNDARYDGGTMEFYRLNYIHFICEWE